MRSRLLPLSREVGEQLYDYENDVSITIYDVAEKAGVSTATVSRVLSGSSRVSQSTRSKVEKIAGDLGYQPHVSAQSLARQKTQLLSAVVPVMTNYFYMGVLKGVQEALNGSEYDLLVYVAPRPEEVDAQLNRALQRGRSDGVLLLSTVVDERWKQRISASNHQVVLVDAFNNAFDSFLVDNERGGFLATQHLIDRGYSRIAHVTVHPLPPPAEARLNGYNTALRQNGNEIDETLIAASTRKPFGFVEEAGYEAMRKLLSLKRIPDAVFVASDIQAMGAMKAIREAGLQIPGDMAIIGFDDINSAGYAGLSTLAQPIQRMGRLAVRRLIERLESPNIEIVHTELEPQLKVRDTT